MLFTGVVSAPTHSEIRDAWRKRCLPKFAGHEDVLRPRFFVGQPILEQHADEKTHAQGVIASDREIKLASDLMTENEAHGDLHVLSTSEMGT